MTRRICNPVDPQGLYRVMFDGYRVFDSMDIAFYRNLIDNLYEGVYYVDAGGRITYWNRSAERITGYQAEEVIGRPCSDDILMHIDHSGVNLCEEGCPLARTMSDGQPREISAFLHHKEGFRLPVSIRAAPIRDDEEKIIGAAEIFTDDSPEGDILASRDILRRQALTDTLTEAGNRKAGVLLLEHRIMILERENISFGLIMFDVDRFSRLNEQFGPNTADRVLKMTSRTVGSILRSFDTLCRWEDDAFIVISPNVTREALLDIAERIRVFVENSWIMSGSNVRIQVTVSVGCAMAGTGDDSVSLISRCRDAMMRHHLEGHNRVFYL